MCFRIVCLVLVGGCRQYGCGGESTTASDWQLANVLEQDGRIALFAGLHIRDKLAAGVDVDSISHLSTFLRVRAPADLVAAVRASPAPLHRKIISLEVPFPALEITFHEPDPIGPTVDDERGCSRVVRAQNLNLVPGSPNLSGRLALYAQPDGLIRPNIDFEWYGCAQRITYGGGGSCDPQVDPDCPPLAGPRMKDAGAPCPLPDAGLP